MKEYLKQVLFLAGGALALGLLWKYPGKALQDVFLWGFFLYGATRGAARWRAWRTPFGWAALAIVLWTVLLAPFGADPRTSFRLLAKQADIVAALLAVPAVFHTRARLFRLLLCAATALTALLACELAGMLATFGAEAAGQARWHYPAILLHHNIGAMAGSVCIVLLAAAGLAGRRRPAVWIPCLLAIGVLAAYETIVASRGAQLALLASLAVFVVGALPGRRLRFAAGGTLLLLGVLLPAVNPRFRDAGMSGVLTDRDKVWKHTWELVREHPLAGHGYGKTVFQQVYQASNPPRSIHPFYHPHNYWLNALFLGGWIAVLLHAALWGLGLAGLARAIRKSETFDHRLLPAAVGAAIVGMLAYGLIDTPTEVISLMMMMMVPAVALLIAEEPPA